MTTETSKLSCHKSVPVSLRPWILGGLFVLLAMVALLSFNARLDTFLWRGTRWLLGNQDAYVWKDFKVDPATQLDAPWYRTMEPPGHGRIYHWTEKAWRIFRDLGEPYTTALLVAVVWIYDRRGWRAGALLAIVATLTGLVSVLIRMVAGRLRPDGHFASGLLNDGVNYWELFRGFGRAGDLSFPSGHATLAFATAAVLAYLSPRGRWLFFFIAAGCSLGRVVMQAHFYSDVLCGGFLGLALGTYLVRRLDAIMAPPAIPYTRPS